MIKQFSDDQIIFKLTLSDGITWGFSATQEIFPWLKKLAEIMQLKIGTAEDVDRKILFLTHYEENEPNYENFSNANWNVLRQGSAYRIWSHNSANEVFVELNRNFLEHDEICVINMWSSLKQLYKYYVLNCSAPIHATFAELNGKGIIIAASGGTGKSTCYNRLPSYWNPCSDDNALILKMDDCGYRIHPMPTWSDHLWGTKNSTFNTSFSVPLCGIFFLEQSSEDRVDVLPKSESVRKLYISLNEIWETYWHKVEKKEKVKMTKLLFGTAFDIVKEVPCYTLRATLHGKFWLEIEKKI